MKDTTWDGESISNEPPFGASVIVYRWTSLGVEFLILHRAHLGADYSGEWAWTPPAGARRPNETLLACAERELAEETGLSVALEPTDFGSTTWPVYRAQVDHSATVRLDAEQDRHEWQPFERAAEMCTPRFISDYMRAVGSDLSAATVPQRFRSTVSIEAPAAAVWRTLTDSDSMRRWLGEPEMQIEVETDWSIGSPIVVTGAHHARFRNRGVVLAFEPPSKLSYTHSSSLSRLPDEPASYTTFVFTLAAAGESTSLALEATGFPTATIFKHLAFYWRGTLEVIKRQAERCSVG